MILLFGFASGAFNHGGTGPRLPVGFLDKYNSQLNRSQANASDPRALRHLEALVEKVKEVTADIPDIQDQIAQCQEAVDMALRIKQGFMDQLNREAGEQGVT